MSIGTVAKKIGLGALKIALFPLYLLSGAQQSEGETPYVGDSPAPPSESKSSAKPK